MGNISSAPAVGTPVNVGFFGAGADPGDIVGANGAPLRIAGSLYVVGSDIGLTKAMLPSDGGAGQAPATMPLILEGIDAVIGLYSLREGSHGSGFVLGEIFPIGTFVDEWFVGKNSSNAPYGLGSSIIFEYGTDPYYPNDPRLMELTKNGQLIVGGGSDAQFYNPVVNGGGIMVTNQVTGVSNAHLDTSARAGGIIVDTIEPRLQLLGDDQGNNAACLILSSAPAAGNNKHWIVHHRGVAQVDAFEIQYITSAATGDIVNGATTLFSISTGGLVTLPTNNGLAFTNQTSGAAASGGTLTNAPSAGNPSHWLRVIINGANRFIPCWT